MNLSLSLQTMARQLPDSPAISWDGGRLSYGQFEDQVARIAGALVQRHGLQRGDRVALAMENCGEFLPVLYGIWRAGLAAIPINSKLHGREIQWIVDNAGAKLIIASPKLADALTATGVALPAIIATGTPDFTRLLSEQRIDYCPPDSTGEAWLFYTSGTTGRPKGAILTHRNLLCAAMAYTADIDFLDETDVCLHAAPLTHGSGLYALAHIARGSHQLVMASFEPAAILKAFATHRNVSMFAAPTMVTRLVRHTNEHGGDTTGLKTIIYGGAPMYVSDLKQALTTFGPKFYQLYGQGESPMTITGLNKRMHAETSHPRYEQRLASAGIARLGCAYRIVDAHGRDVPDGEIGEIITISDCVMQGYWNNPEANARALRGGWLWTGDLGSRDADGFLTLKDRSKDLIISGGANIYPREIEDVLLTDARVLECAVVSRPHLDWGEEVIAYVVTKPGSAPLDEKALDRLCLANIARFKRPKGYRFVDTLPKNNYGKVLKTELRALLKDETGSNR